MTKKDAIAKAIEDVNGYTTWYEAQGAWIQHRHPYNRHEVKCARIERALVYLGHDPDRAGYRVWVADEFEGLSLREAIYKNG